MVYGNDHSIYSGSPAEQLLLWTRARKDAIAHNRSRIVLASLRELGFELEYTRGLAGNSSPHKAAVPEYLLCETTTADVEAFTAIRQNRTAILGSTLTTHQAKKIALLLSIGFEPTATIDAKTATIIVEQLEALKQAHWVNRITVGRADLVQQIVDSDA